MSSEASKHELNESTKTSPLENFIKTNYLRLWRNITKSFEWKKDSPQGDTKKSSKASDCDPEFVY